MILCIGEILVDIIGHENDSSMLMNVYVGGAPFNVAVNAKQSGAKVGFVGRVGRDVIGNFIEKAARKANLDYLEIQRDKKRNTTLAFVTLTSGERDFSFFRQDTADFNIDAAEIDLEKFEDLNIVHLGSLMISEELGGKFAKTVVEKIRRANKKFSFDVNFRMDLYENMEQAKSAYKPFIEEADILKFSDDEILAYTGKENVDEAIKSLKKDNRLLLITMGSRGSLYDINGERGMVVTKKVKPIDTTGAGDAFFGATLAFLDGKIFNKDNIEKAMQYGNKAGAATTQFNGALKI